MELAKIKLMVSRKDLKVGVYKPKKEQREGTIKLPVEDVVLGILDRLINSKRGEQNGDQKSGGVHEVFQ